MRTYSLFLTTLLGGATACIAVRAQVNFDPRALNQLNNPPAQSQPATPAPHPNPQGTKPATREHTRTQEQRRPAHPTNRRETTPTTPAPSTVGTANPAPAAAVPAKPAAPPDARKLPVPATPPPVANLPPPIAVPVRPAPAPTPASIKQDAAGLVSKLSNGVRLTFGTTSTDLNPETDAAIKSAVHAAPPFDTTTFNVDAYAAGTPEDPSTARRLALSRALAVRSVLIAEGVASVRIYVKALGSNGAGVGDGPPDRVDLIVNTPPPAAQQKLP